MMYLRIRTFLLFTISYILLFSCTPGKKIIYLQDIPNATTQQLDSVCDYFIRSNDILDITVTSLSPEMDAIFNAISRPLQNTGNTTGFLVGKDGFINLPFAGRKKVAGLQPDSLKNIVADLLRPFLNEPVVNVRLANFKVSVLGEVAKPGTFLVANEKISLLEAISMAGDLTISARRSNVLVVREQDGLRMTERIDLTKSNFFHSSFYYLQPNDVIYVEPLKSKIAQNDTKTWQVLTFTATLLSLVTIILTRAKF